MIDKAHIEKLNKYRLERHMPVTELARLIGVSRGVLKSALEGGSVWDFNEYWIKKFIREKLNTEVMATQSQKNPSGRKTRQVGAADAG